MQAGAQIIEHEPAGVTAEVLRDPQINHVHKIRSEPLDAHTRDRPHFAAKLSRAAQFRPESQRVDRRRPPIRSQTRVVVRTSNEPGVAQPATEPSFHPMRPTTCFSQAQSPVLTRHAPRMRKLYPATLPRRELGAKGSPLWSFRV